MSKNILLSAIVPHPPIIIPEIGKDECNKTQKTIEALAKLSSEITDLNPDTTIIITPHSVMSPYYFSVYTGETLNGSFSNFGVPEVSLEWQNDTEFIQELEANIKEDFIRFNKLPSGVSIDHGSLVPLYYLRKAGYKNKIVIINYCALSTSEHIKFGKHIASVINSQNKKTVVLASGDLSHKLLQTAPAGFDPEAVKFDELIIESIKTGDYSNIINIESDLRNLAGECGYNSLVTVIGAIAEKPCNNELLSYEAPFGVGYIVAKL